MKNQRIDYSNLAEVQLLNLAKNNKGNIKKIRKEWFLRYQVSFPYRVNAKGQIINGFTESEVPDELCDRVILQQANELREKRKNRVKAYKGHYVG